MKTIEIDKNGFYGEFGGAFIPEMLHPAVKELSENYLKIIESEEFQTEYHALLRDYVGRPSPLYLAHRLSEKYGAKIYLKREDLNHTGAHKINNTIGQILIAKKMGKHKIIAETGAGQHGVATATVCALFGMECTIFMGKTDVERQQLNVKKMEMLGASVVAVTSGNMTLKDAVTEAVNYWALHCADTFYLIGSTVGPHPYPDMVARLQSVISSEIKEQMMQKEGRANPDRIIACVGGGSNAAGAIYHYLNDFDVKITFAEAAGLGLESGETAATMLLGKQGTIHGFKTMVMQDEHGEVTEPYSISAGLDYPGVGPLQAHLSSIGRANVIPVTDEEALQAAFELTRLEGIIPALESSHALGTLPKIQFKKNEVVVLSLSGRGDKDMETYLAQM